MTGGQELAKRCFDVAFAAAVIVLLGWLILVAILAATLDTGAWGVFAQTRIGRHGRPFRVFKIRTMRDASGPVTHVTSSRDPRITRLGRWLRRHKVDELPQFVNVLLGDMSVVGPRPDMPGFADELEGDDRRLLLLRPGVTGPAALVLRDEEVLLAGVARPEAFNKNVLWPLKVHISCDYVDRYSFLEDLRLIADTTFPRLRMSRAMKAAPDLRGSLLDPENAPATDLPSVEPPSP